MQMKGRPKNQYMSCKFMELMTLPFVMKVGYPNWRKGKRNQWAEYNHCTDEGGGIKRPRIKSEDMNHQYL